MTPSLRHIGPSRHPLVVVDDFSGAVDDIVAIAAALAPFPPATGYYPGLRHEIGSDDGAANDYVTVTLEAAAPFIGGAFGAEAFDLVGASFSMVTAAPSDLKLAQRMPHFDSTDPGYLAVLHYLSDTPGTAFYRQRSTGIDAVTDANRASFIAAATREGTGARGYIAGSDAAFEQIGSVEGRRDRLVIYQGRLLHSGIIPADGKLDADPRIGRLTANLFVQATR